MARPNRPASLARRAPDAAPPASPAIGRHQQGAVEEAAGLGAEDQEKRQLEQPIGPRALRAARTTARMPISWATPKIGSPFKASRQSTGELKARRLARWASRPPMPSGAGQLAQHQQQRDHRQEGRNDGQDVRAQQQVARRELVLPAQRIVPARIAQADPAALHPAGDAGRRDWRARRYRPAAQRSGRPGRAGPAGWPDRAARPARPPTNGRPGAAAARRRGAAGGGAAATTPAARERGWPPGRRPAAAGRRGRAPAPGSRSAPPGRRGWPAARRPVRDAARHPALGQRPGGQGQGIGAGEVGGDAQRQLEPAHGAAPSGDRRPQQARPSRRRPAPRPASRAPPSRRAGRRARHRRAAPRRSRLTSSGILPPRPLPIGSDDDAVFERRAVHPVAVTQARLVDRDDRAGRQLAPQPGPGLAVDGHPEFRPVRGHPARVEEGGGDHARAASAAVARRRAPQAAGDPRPARRPAKPSAGGDAQATASGGHGRSNGPARGRGSPLPGDQERRRHPQQPASRRPPSSRFSSRAATR